MYIKTCESYLLKGIWIIWTLENQIEVQMASALPLEEPNSPSRSTFRKSIPCQRGKRKGVSQVFCRFLVSSYTGEMVSSRTPAYPHIYHSCSPGAPPGPLVLPTSQGHITFRVGRSGKDKTISFLKIRSRTQLICCHKNNLK